MKWIQIFIKALGTGILCSLVYHGTLLLIGQRVVLKNAAAFTIAFSLLYFVWLCMASTGKKSE